MMEAQKVRRATTAKGPGVSFLCPGCDDVHAVHTGPGGWEWNGDLVRPTLSPSVLIRSGHYIPGHQGDICWCTWNRDNPDNPSPFKCTVCHSFVREGSIEFLNDSTHALAGKTVELPGWGA